jgi:hypothetical protein
MCMRCPMRTQSIPLARSGRPKALACHFICISGMQRTTASAHVNIIDTHCQLFGITLSHFSVRKQKLRLVTVVFRESLYVFLVGFIPWRDRFLSARGFKRAGRHSKYAIYTVLRCVRRDPGGSSEPPEPPISYSLTHTRPP